jgi:hypothetical protein
MRAMEDRYRLVYRGELLDGQHRAVVRKRLGALLKVEGDRLDALFAGAAVVIRNEADTATAARIQAAFKQAGARLRVVPLIEAPAAGTDAAPAAPAKSPSFTLRPRSGELLDPSERPAPATVQVDVSHLSLAPLGPWVAPARATVDSVPDTSLLSIAEVGALLSETAALPTSLEVTLPDWDIAPSGADLGPRRPAATPAVDLAQIHFELSPVGADLGQKRAPPPAPPPDTSRLRLVRE